MELGFVEEVENPVELTSPYYPSKVGGKPAWLDLHKIPSLDVLACKKCGKTLIHLLQIQSSSSPSDEIGEHRTVFVFFCSDSRCHSLGDSSSFLVLRCELEAHDNDINNTGSLNSQSCNKMNLERTKTNGDDKNNSSSNSEVSDRSVSQSPDKVVDKKAPTLCIVCGNIGPKHCGRCRQVNYCCRDHQVHDWKVGHKQICADLASGVRSPELVDYDPSAGMVLPEFEIVTELEPSVCTDKEERSEEERMKDYHKFMKENSKGKVEEVATVEELEKAATASKVDKYFRAFKKRTSVEPTQVLRYGRSGEPLFVSGERIPKPSDVPDCECGAKRTFELQIMPQLLYYLKLDQEDPCSPGSKGGSSLAGAGVDWGTLLIYTCSSACCSLGPGYHQEFLWKQDIV